MCKLILAGTFCLHTIKALPCCWIMKVAWINMNAPARFSRNALSTVKHPNSSSLSFSLVWREKDEMIMRCRSFNCDGKRKTTLVLKPKVSSRSVALISTAYVVQYFSLTTKQPQPTYKPQKQPANRVYMIWLGSRLLEASSVFFLPTRVSVTLACVRSAS
jgi:hypothetical protein